MRTLRAGSYSGAMSSNYTAYVQKMTELRSRPAPHRPLVGQLAELLAQVRECEARWALEDRIEGRSH